METGSPANILVRGANWVGDAVMTLPALDALILHYPQARVTVMTRPWVAGVYQGRAGVAQVLADDNRGGLLTRGPALVRELAARNFDLAVLFPNAFSAALFTALARIPERWGYARDGRGFLLTRPARPERPASRSHEVFYYLNLMEKLGLSAPYRPPRLAVTPEARAEAEALLERAGLKAGEKFLALAPGAAFGPAKRWPEEKFARAAELILQKSPAWTVILGGRAEAEAAGKLTGLLPAPRLNLAGRTTLATAMAVLSRAFLLLTNDSGLMHLGGALGVPLAAVFGPTSHLATAPLGASRLLISTAACAPCLKRVCPLPRQICFDRATPESAAAAGLELLEDLARPARGRPAVFLDLNILGLEKNRAVRPGEAAAAAALTRQGYHLIMAGNAETAASLKDSLAAAGADQSALAILPDQPGGAAGPRANAYQRLAEALELDLGRSFWVGRASALAPAGRPGARSVLVPGEGPTGDPHPGETPCPTLTAPDFRRAVEWILA